MSSKQKVCKLNNTPGPYYIGESERDLNNFKPPTAALIGIDDYPRWYRKMKAYLARSKKLGFVDGSIKAPAKQTEYEAWRNCNDLAFKWILNSLSHHNATKIKDRWIDNAAVAWRKLKEWYSPGDLLIVSQFLVQIHTFKQDKDIDVTYFLAKINSLWKELDILRPQPKCACSRKCSCGAWEKLKKQREEEILGVFLNGLNRRFHPTRSRIVKMNPLPSPTEACSIIIEEHDLTAPSVR